jgi:hypothetical protein
MSVTERQDVAEANRLILGADDSDRWLYEEDIKKLDPSRFEGMDEAVLERHCYSFATGFHELRHVEQASNTSAALLFAARHRWLALAALQGLGDLRKEGLTRLAIPLLSPAGENLIHPQTCRKSLQGLRTRLALLYRQLLDLTGDSGGTIGEALAIDQRVEQAAPGNGFHASSAFAHDDAVSPLGLTLRHLLEAETRLHDTWALAKAMLLGVPKAVVTRVAEGLSQAEEYTLADRVFRKLTKNLASDAPHPQLLAATVELALWPVPLIADGNLWEDIQPCWRFLKICVTLPKVAVPTNPLEQFGEFCEPLCEANAWTSPFEAMRRRVKDQAPDRWADPLLNDLYRRHKLFAEEVLRTGRLPFYPDDAPAAFFEQFKPWVITAGGRFLFQNYPKTLKVERVAFELMQHSLGQDVLFRRDLDRSRTLYEQMTRHLVRRGEWTEERVRSQYQEYVDGLITGDGQATIVSA